jgi:uncharacterized protein involved in outer membrane biogenesis
MTDTPAQQGPRAPNPRRKHILLGLVAVLLAIPAIALAVLLTYDWNKARPWLNAKTSEAIGRPFAIRGNLSLQWEKPANAIAEHERIWRDFIPWPHLIANDVHVGNPPGMPARDMASVRQFSFSLNPFGLLHHTIAIPVLRFDAPAVELLRSADGSNNWTFKQENRPSPWKLDLERVVLSKGVLHLSDAVEKADVTANVDTINADPVYGVSFKLHGTYNNGPVSGSGKAGAVLSLKQQSTPYPLQADLRVGATHINLEGSITRPAKLAAIDLKLKVSGNSMARLYNLTGVLLPETPAFSTDGRLIGTLDGKSSRWTYDKFKGKVGSSDIGGHLVFQTGKPRGKLSGDVASRLLQFSDLAPLIGADSNESKQARGVAPVQPPGKVLPVETFHTERWKKVDADVKFSATRIVREKQLPIGLMSTHLVMNDGVLTLEPLKFDMAGGNLQSNIRLDGSGRQNKNAILATAKVSARHIQLQQLFPSIEKVQASVGQINGDAQLSGTGNSVASMLGDSNGEITALINQGTVSKLLLEELGLNIGNVVLTKLFGDKPVKLNCMATDFGVTNGLMQTRLFVVDTEEAVITASGTVNLADERIDLTVRPETKSLRIFSLRAPLYVRGPFIKPDVSVDKRVLAMKAGGAAALAAIAAPIAALLPLINTGPGKDSECGRLLADARIKPVAPPPGQTSKR